MPAYSSILQGLSETTQIKLFLAAEERRREDEKRREANARRAKNLSAVSTLAGGAIGAYYGGEGGRAAGAALGASAGGIVGPLVFGKGESRQVNAPQSIQLALAGAQFYEGSENRKANKEINQAILNKQRKDQAFADATANNQAQQTLRTTTPAPTEGGINLSDETLSRTSPSVIAGMVQGDPRQEVTGAKRAISAMSAENPEITSSQLYQDFKNSTGSNVSQSELKGEFAIHERTRKQILAGNTEPIVRRAEEIEAQNQKVNPETKEVTGITPKSKLRQINELISQSKFSSRATPEQVKTMEGIRSRAITAVKSESVAARPAESSKLDMVSIKKDAIRLAVLKSGKQTLIQSLVSDGKTYEEAIVAAGGIDEKHTLEAEIELLKARESGGKLSRPQKALAKENRLETEAELKALVKQRAQDSKGIAEAERLQIEREKNEPGFFSSIGNLFSGKEVTASPPSGKVGSVDNPARPASQAQFSLLPSGAYYIDPKDPESRIRIKP